MTRQIIKEIEADAKKFGDPRRTLIEAVASVAPAEISVPDEPVTVIVSKNGWVRCRQGHGIDPAAIGYKTGDFPFAIIETRTVWPVVVLDTQGRAYTVKVSDLPGGRGDGTPITTLVDFQEGGKLAQVLTAAPETRWFFSQSGGYGFICSLAEATSRQRAGKAFMSLEKGERVLPPAPLVGEWIAAVSEQGRLLLFPLAEMKVQAGGRGVIVMALEDGEALADVAVPADAAILVVEGVGRAGKPLRLEIKPGQRETWRGKRARKGAVLTPKIRPTGLSCA